MKRTAKRQNGDTGKKIIELKVLQHTKSTIIKKTGKERRQTPYVYLSREALDELNWELNKLVTVEYDLVHSRITIREMPEQKNANAGTEEQAGGQAGGRNGAAILTVPA
jgi:hypothetical protein